MTIYSIGKKIIGLAVGLGGLGSTIWAIREKHNKNNAIEEKKELKKQYEEQRRINEEKSIENQELRQGNKAQSTENEHLHEQLSLLEAEQKKEKEEAEAIKNFDFSELDGLDDMEET